MTAPFPTSLARPTRASARRALSHALLTCIAIPLAACTRSDSGATDDAARTRATQQHPASPQPSRAAVDAPAPPPARTVVTLGTPLWTRGGDETDLAIRTPSALAADSALAYVLDYATNTITALDAATGRARWTTASARPAILVTPIVIAARPGGGVSVADAGTNQILSLAAHDGRVERTVPLTGDAHPLGICPRPDGSTLLADPAAGAQLIRLSAAPANATPTTIAYPWPALHGAPALVTQAWLTPVADGTACALALVAGDGLALMDDTGVRWRQRYVEPSAPPTPRITTVTRGDTTTTRSSLATTTLAANALGAVGPYIAVAFEGHSPARSRLIDLYRADDGRYAGSLETDAPVRAVAGNRDGLLIIVTRRAGRPMIAAYSLPAAPEPR